MKKFLFIMLLASSQLAFGQDQTTIKKDFETIVLKTSQNKIAEVLDMTYPRLFEVMPKEQMAALATGMMGAMGMKTIMEEKPLNLKMSGITKLPASTICLGSYDQSMRMEFEQPAMMNVMLQAGTKENPVEKIDGKTIRMTGKGYLLAIKDSYTKNTWKYLRYDKESQDLNNKVLSKEILQKVAELKAGLATAK